MMKVIIYMKHQDFQYISSFILAFYENSEMNYLSTYFMIQKNGILNRNIYSLIDSRNNALKNEDYMNSLQRKN